MARADGDSRHKMALQVSLDTAGEAEVERKVEEVLTLLSQVVSQQPTAMALIRSHQT